MASVLRQMTMGEASFLSLLTDFIGKTEKLQNNPPNLIPQESLVVTKVLEVLGPYSIDNGGPLLLKPIYFQGLQNRKNLIVTYPGEEQDRIVSIVGCHMDVVVADPTKWEHSPFKLTQLEDGDTLYGRGTTDCLGHVALVTQLLKQMAEAKLRLKTTVAAVFIANEENATVLGIGADALMDAHELDFLKNGPLYWMDSSDKQPCIGTGGMLAWHLTAHGKLSHSGLPKQGINAIELASEGLKEIQDRFYNDFPKVVPDEDNYKFDTPSTMKPTQWTYPGSAINQIPDTCTISGDCRITPFYKVDEVEKKLVQYVDYINQNIEKLETRGPASKYVLPDGTRGKLEITFDAEKMQGIACHMDSKGYKALAKATEEVLGHVEPFSITGSLPIVGDLQDQGYDVQTIGYGLTSAYHADNEICLLSDMSQGFKIFAILIADLDNSL
ncbi:acetylornithine deacetylase [Selaginella moellendorffii]|nr:acetylornithine deacetylase [Selaginella moellendorffii]|eukprot:XP_002969699.2 acetylornithine deacetylase [Selaginella moellendorffii]